MPAGGLANQERIRLDIRLLGLGPETLKERRSSILERLLARRLRYATRETKHEREADNRRFLHVEFSLFFSLRRLQIIVQRSAATELDVSGVVDRLEGFFEQQRKSSPR
jgi:hypothetical protein